ncbi:hypothetical protein [Brachyspira sp.]|uniref:hypothetical protein n=1 Tax=Brachyspira sp. TaxID=1977261 RepID=UPI002612F7BA|nr:hypothetical protein [Brachyspira sp.]
MVRKIYCLMTLIMLLLSCADKNKKETNNKNSINVIEDEEYIKNVVKDSSK